MPAMHDDVYQAMFKQLERKKDLFLRTLPFSMTHAECLRLIAPSDHIDILTKAARFADINSSEGWVTLKVPAVVDGVPSPQVMLFMRTHGEMTPPLRPRHPQWQPGQAGLKVIEWLAKRYEIGRRFGTAGYALHRLNMACETGYQLRYMFPAALHLCKDGVNPRMDRWMEKFAAYKPCRYAPAVSPELKKAIQDSSALLTSMALIGDDILQPDAGPVCISEVDMSAFMIGGDVVSRM